MSQWGICWESWLYTFDWKALNVTQMCACIDNTSANWSLIIWDFFFLPDLHATALWLAHSIAITDRRVFLESETIRDHDLPSSRFLSLDKQESEFPWPQWLIKPLDYLCLYLRWCTFLVVFETGPQWQIIALGFDGMKKNTARGRKCRNAKRTVNRWAVITSNGLINIRVEKLWYIYIYTGSHTHTHTVDVAQKHSSLQSHH